MTRQLLQGMLAGTPGGRIQWSGVPVGPGAGNSLVAPDWVTWFGEAFDLTGAAHCVYIHFESTTHNLEVAAEYTSEKILQLCRLIDEPGLKGRLTKLASDPKDGAAAKLQPNLAHY